MIKTFKKLEKKLLQPDKRHHKKHRANLHNERQNTFLQDKKQDKDV